MAFDMHSTFYQMDVLTHNYVTHYSLCDDPVTRIGVRFPHGHGPVDYVGFYGDIDADKAFDYAAAIKADAELEHGQNWFREKLFELYSELSFFAEDTKRDINPVPGGEKSLFDDDSFQRAAAVILLIALENPTEWKRQAFRSVINSNKQKGHEGWHVELVWWVDESEVTLQLLDSWVRVQRTELDRLHGLYGTSLIAPAIYAAYPEELPI